MISSIKTYLLVIVICVNAFSQDLPKDKTQKHIQVAGTNIFLVPPRSFSLSTNFKGFQNPDDQTSMIMIVEVPGPFNEVSKGFNTEILKNRGMDLKLKKEIKVANFNGLLIELEQESNDLLFSKQILIYGNEKETVIINGVFVKDSINVGQEIKESILSTVLDENLVADPRAALSYTVNETVGSLYFLSVMGNSMLFNRDLKTPTQSADKVSLIIDKSFAKLNIENKKLFCISRIKKYPEDYSMIIEKGIKELEIANMTGYELYAENKDEEMYQVILFDEDGTYYIFVGTYIKGSEKALSDIKSIIMTFERK